MDETQSYKKIQTLTTGPVDHNAEDLISSILSRLKTVSQLAERRVPDTFGGLFHESKDGPLPAAKWESPDVIPGTEEPLIVVEQNTLKNVIGDWSIRLATANQPKGAKGKYVNSYVLTGDDPNDPSQNSLTVEQEEVRRHEIDGFYQGITTMGTVYDPSRDMANRAHLEAVAAALQYVEECLR